MSARGAYYNSLTTDSITTDLTTTDAASEIMDFHEPGLSRTLSHSIPDTTPITNIMRQRVYKDAHRHFYEAAKSATDTAPPTTSYPDLLDMANAAACRLIPGRDIRTLEDYENIFENAANFCERDLIWYESPQQEFMKQLDRQLPDAYSRFDITSYRAKFGQNYSNVSSRDEALTVFNKMEHHHRVAQEVQFVFRDMRNFDFF